MRGFTILGDASKAHRRIAIRPSDWGPLGCKTREGHIWVNEVGTYGVASAGYYWSRLAGALHRIGFYLVGGGTGHDALLFADDWLSVAGGRGELEDIVGVVFMMARPGISWNSKKFRGGEAASWVG